MTKNFKHAGVEYNSDQLIFVKGQCAIIKTNAEECFANADTIISADIKRPLVVRQDKKFLILIDTAHPRNDRNFEVILISKHVLKKTKVLLELGITPARDREQQPSVLQGSPWILASDSARREIYF